MMFAEKAILVSVRGISLGICLILSIFFWFVDSFPNFAFILYVLSAVLFFSSFYYASFVPQLRRHKSDLLIAGAFVFFSFCLFSFRLSEITPGLWGDELGPGEMWQELIVLGRFTPFLPYNYGHATPLVYFSGFFISILGRSVESLRIVSVLFGALSVGAMFMALRSIFHRWYAVAGAVLLATSYVFTIGTRFGYEISAAVFFFIVSAWLFSKFCSERSAHYLISLGLFLGTGMYTYLGFRTIFGVIFLTTIWKILREKRMKIVLFSAFFVSLLLVLSPLITYGVRHPEELSARINSLSVFHQDLPRDEVLRELQGAALRTLSMFFVTGDPNPRQNPAVTPPFDLLSVGIFLLGLGVLVWKRHLNGMFVVLLISAILLAEIVALERIPDFHYYGIGHPNTLRIALLVPIMIFVGLFGVENVMRQTSRLTWREPVLLVGLVLTISGINLNRYYGQLPNKWIHQLNFVTHLRIIETLNTRKPTQPVIVSPELFESAHVRYLLDPSIRLEPITLPLDCEFQDPTQRVRIILAADLAVCTEEQLQILQLNSRYTVITVSNPWQTVDAFFLFEQENN